ncbi:MAG: hypothetical protein NNA23_05595 [Nitrospira sp.]|nr:hypothetical protein [Nitrospira sp.]
MRLILGVSLLSCLPPSTFATMFEALNRPVAQPIKQASASVGSAMAVLATLEQAGVLPPEGTKEADGVIRVTIQIQSLFMKSTDQTIQAFLYRALAAQGAEGIEQRLAKFQTTGWTAEVLMALADAALAASPEELRSLLPGLASFRLSIEDFQQFMRLIKDGERALVSAGRTFEEVFASQRQLMPGVTAR